MTETAMPTRRLILAALLLAPGAARAHAPRPGPNGGQKVDIGGNHAELVAEGKSVDEIYEALVIADIRRAADLLAPIYAQTQGKDGYIVWCDL